MERFFFAVKAIIVRDEKFLALYDYKKGNKRWDLPGMEFWNWDLILDHSIKFRSDIS